MQAIAGGGDTHTFSSGLVDNASLEHKTGSTDCCQFTSTLMSWHSYRT